LVPEEEIDLKKARLIDFKKEGGIEGEYKTLNV
jgi:hypothetical protein